MPTRWTFLFALIITADTYAHRCDCKAISVQDIVDTTRELCPVYRVCQESFELDDESSPSAKHKLASFEFAVRGSMAFRLPGIVDMAKTCLGPNCSAVFTSVWMELASNGIRCASTHSFDIESGKCHCDSPVCYATLPSPPSAVTERPFHSTLVYTIFGTAIAATVSNVLYTHARVSAVRREVMATVRARRS